MERIATALDVPLATVKSMAFKRKGLINMDAQEIKDKLAKIAKIVDVSGADLLMCAAMAMAMLMCISCSPSAVGNDVGQ